MKTLVLSLVLAVSGLAARAVTLVPAPREFVPGSGEYVVRIPESTSPYFEAGRRTAAVAAAKVSCETDASLPPEGYRLTVAGDGVALASADAAGRFYAFETLKQLAEVRGKGTVAFPCCTVRDFPRYRWRGLMIDEARHFLGKTAVLRILDAMAMHKLNVLHWHLVDDQGWRIEIKGHPELVEYGAVRPRSVKFGCHATWPDGKLHYELDNDRYGPFFHTHDDVREILAYAKARQITVVPEIELPGHVRALLAAHPELSCKGNLERIPRLYWSIEDDVLCIGNDATLRLLEDIFDEVCALFPDTPYIHIGGDECPRIRWKECPKCQARMRAEGMKEEGDLQAWITSRMARYIERKGRRVVGWDEILAGDVPTSAIGMTWRMSRRGGAGTHFVSAADAASRGHDMVMTPNALCYLSYRQFEKGDPHPYYSPWERPLKMERIYNEYDPVAGIPEAARAHIIGGQASVWGEAIWTLFDFEWKTWPRACAIAELLWTAPEKRDYAEFRARMVRHRERLLDAQINCAPLESAALPTDEEITRTAYEAARENETLQARLRDRVSLADYRGLVRTAGGTNVWTAALQKALDEHEVVVIPASAETYYLDAPVTIPSNRRIEATGAVIRLADGTRTLMLRNANTRDGTCAPVPSGHRDSNIAVVGGRWEDCSTRRLGYGASGRYDPVVREKGRFFGVSTLFLFSNCDHVTVTDATFHHAGAFAIQAGEGTGHAYRRIRFDACFADGIHLNGNLSRVLVQDVRGRVGDDLVALNAYDWLNSSVNFGPQRSVVCEDLELQGKDAYPAIRIQPACFRFADGSVVDCSISDVVFRRVKGIQTFKMYLQTPRYRIGTEPEWSRVGSGGNLFFEDIDIDLKGPLDRLGGYKTSDPLRGHYGAFEFGANLTSITFRNVDITFHLEDFPLGHLATVGPKSAFVPGREGEPGMEIFDPYVNCSVGRVSIENLKVHGTAPSEMVRPVVFDDINRDGRSTGRGTVERLEVR